MEERRFQNSLKMNKKLSILVILIIFIPSHNTFCQVGRNANAKWCIGVYSDLLFANTKLTAVEIYGGSTGGSMLVSLTNKATTTNWQMGVGIEYIVSNPEWAFVFNFQYLDYKFEIQNGLLAPSQGNSYNYYQNNVAYTGDTISFSDQYKIKGFQVPFGISIGLDSNRKSCVIIEVIYGGALKTGTRNFENGGSVQASDFTQSSGKNLDLAAKYRLCKNLGSKLSFFIQLSGSKNLFGKFKSSFQNSWIEALNRNIKYGIGLGFQFKL